MTDDQFTKLFKYVEKRFSDMDMRFNSVDGKFDQLQVSVDAYAKQVLDLTQEHLMLARKVDRMEEWLHKIANKAGVKLEY